MKARAFAVFADAPILFFAVVIGVALTFRVAVGVVRDAKTPPVVAPTFVTGPEPGLEAGPRAAASRARAVRVDRVDRVRPVSRGRRCGEGPAVRCAATRAGRPQAAGPRPEADALIFPPWALP